ncbi:MAG: GTPase [archaeon]|nr:GTPase [archaeon]
MNIYVLGGFLGSGKTTLLMKIASMFSERGKKVSIIVNEMGTIGVDGTTIKRQGYNAVELPEGCICCTLTGTLQKSVIQVVNDYYPDILIIEPTGLALPDKVKSIIEAIKGTSVEYDQLKIVGILDCLRFDIFITKKKDFYLKQLMHSDVLVVNKKDLVSEKKLQSIVGQVSEMFPNIKIISMSATSGDGVLEILEVL